MNRRNSEPWISASPKVALGSVPIVGPLPLVEGGEVEEGAGPAEVESEQAGRATSTTTAKKIRSPLICPPGDIQLYGTIIGDPAPKIGPRQGVTLPIAPLLRAGRTAPTTTRSAAARGQAPGMPRLPEGRPLADRTEYTLPRARGYFRGVHPLTFHAPSASLQRRRNRKASRPEEAVRRPPRSIRSANPSPRGPRCRSEARRASTGSPWRRRAFRGFGDSLGAPRRPICRA